MIRSMTGFGEATHQAESTHYAIEIRSLNNRYFKATIRLPEPIAGLEPELETLLRKKLTRGSITLIVRLWASTFVATHRVNDQAILNYMEHLATLRAKLASTEHAVNIDLTALLALPGVLQPIEDEQTLLARTRPMVLQLAEKACDRLLTMRVTEGKSIVEDILQQRQYILERVQHIAQRVPQVVHEYHHRLQARVNELISKAELKVSESDLLREVAIYAERSDVAEEIKRLSEHLEQIQRIMTATGEEPAGRTLDFLSQELLREANTIASKSNDANISRMVVEIKGAIDRIKEQVQNIE